MALNVRIVIVDDDNPGVTQVIPLIYDQESYPQVVEIDPTQTAGLYAIQLSAFTHGMEQFYTDSVPEVGSASPRILHFQPDLSVASAVAELPEKTKRLCQAIYLVLRARGPLTDEELSALLTEKNFEHTPSGLRSRRAELTAAAWLRDSGEKRPTKAGNLAVAWMAAT